MEPNIEPFRIKNNEPRLLSDQLLRAQLGKTGFARLHVLQGVRPLFGVNIPLADNRFNDDRMPSGEAHFQSSG